MSCQDGKRGSYRSEAHALDIIQVVDQALVGTAAVARDGALLGGRAVSAGEAVRQDLVDGLLLPLGAAQGLRDGGGAPEE